MNKGCELVDCIYHECENFFNGFYSVDLRYFQLLSYYYWKYAELHEIAILLLFIWPKSLQTISKKHLNSINLIDVFMFSVQCLHLVCT